MIEIIGIMETWYCFHLVKRFGQNPYDARAIKFSKKIAEILSPHPFQVFFPLDKTVSESPNIDLDCS